MTGGLAEEGEAGEEKTMMVLQGPEGDVSFRLLLNRMHFRVKYFTFPE